ncbi:MAG: hypothetical protein QXL16_01050 [Candidatus Micrarchaeaceae archaeon]
MKWNYEAVKRRLAIVAMFITFFATTLTLRTLSNMNDYFSLFIHITIPKGYNLTNVSLFISAPFYLRTDYLPNITSKSSDILLIYRHLDKNEEYTITLDGDISCKYCNNETDYNSTVSFFANRSRIYVYFNISR